MLSCFLIALLYDTSFVSSSSSLTSVLTNAEAKRRKRARAAVVEDDQAISGTTLHLERLQTIQNQVLSNVTKSKKKKKKRDDN